MKNETINTILGVYLFIEIIVLLSCFQKLPTSSFLGLCSAFFLGLILILCLGTLDSLEDGKK